MRKKLILAGIVATAALTLTACGGGDPLSSDSGGGEGASDTVIVGSADFAESQLLATIYSQALQNAGVEVEEKLNIGSREIYLEALRDGSINLLPEYNGSLLAELGGEIESGDPEGLAAQLDELLAPDELIVLDASEAENADTLVVTPDVAAEHDLKTISDLEPVAGELVLAGPAEWKSRFEGVPGLEEVYGLAFKEFKVLDAGGPLTLTALQNGQAQVGDMFSSDPAIEANGLVALEDDKGLFPPANILPVISENVASDEVTEVLNAISAALTTENLMEMNDRIANGDDINQIATDWLEVNGI
ncbi:ABC transporter substrate-binding protein [Leucobacter manosquensis]|uniref:ABC transporter substrate-binding protein n=1 Tax=Leucobacter manosquensis TaxID=2810611 RepID=A0ABS5M4L1_9MICO|nr:ABC transporter substrate-binding protein [Leucobacter manosquensis]MBS3181925.1 ABC transporter substrate-binding protein [Leucobacter manosquensis]